MARPVKILISFRKGCFREGHISVRNLDISKLCKKYAITPWLCTSVTHYPFGLFNFVGGIPQHTMCNHSSLIFEGLVPIPKSIYDETANIPISKSSHQRKKTTVMISVWDPFNHFSHLESKDLVSFPTKPSVTVASGLGISKYSQGFWPILLCTACSNLLIRQAGKVMMMFGFGSSRTYISFLWQKPRENLRTLRILFTIQSSQKNPVERTAILQGALCKPWHDYAWSQTLCFLVWYCRAFLSWLQGVSFDCHFRKGCLKGLSWKPISKRQGSSIFLLGWYLFIYFVNFGLA